MGEASWSEYDGCRYPTGAGYSYGFPEEDYHRGLVMTRVPDESGAPVLEESLSYSGAKLLIPPSTPLKFKEHVRRSSKAFDFGHAAHLNVLGVGAPVEFLPTTGWLTKDGKPAVNYALTEGYRTAKAEIEARGHIALNENDMAVLKAMEDRLRATETALDYLTGAGESEVSIWAQDPVVGCWLRGRVDHWNQARNVFVDYKTCASDVHPMVVGAEVWKRHYELQAAWYLGLAELLSLDVQDFVFVCQEKTPPYEVAAIRLDAASLNKGVRERRAAIDLWATCMETGVWPGIEDKLHTVGLPSRVFYLPGEADTSEADALERLLEEGVNNGD